jgi:hypothetical protein
MKLALKKCFCTHTHTPAILVQVRQTTRHHATMHQKQRNGPPRKWSTEQLKGSNKTKSQRLGVKKYFANASPPKWPLDWLQQLIHLGTLTWGVWGAYQAANNLLWYITLHCILLCGNLAVHFQLGMTPCYCVRMGYLLTYAALDITNKNLPSRFKFGTYRVS